MGGVTFLYGAPASGKTTLGRRLAAALGRAFIDLDAEIVARAGRTIPEIFKADGEVAFRNIESDVLRQVAVGSDLVVSLGGGTLLRDENRRFCESCGVVLCIDSPSEEELARRIGSAEGSRPLGNRARERAPHYASFTNRVADSFDLGNSLVVVGRGIVRSLIGGIPVVADEAVGTLWADRLGIAPISCIPSGEQNKTPQTISDLWHAFAKTGLGRRDCVIALGGGVTGDLVGFAAATWMRGMDWINVPTTLLSMVDASTGGKTGCDLPEGKNLAGAFHSPKVVVIDADFLETLPPDILASGRAEMVKHEIIGGLSPDNPADGMMPTAASIARNLAVKVGIVRDDPFERTGRRLLLNCGHTVAHAVETLSHYRISHGQAVAIGCVEEARLAVRLGLSAESWPSEVAKLFSSWGLPVALPGGIGGRELVAAMKGDKKRSGDIVTFALPCAFGDVRAVPVNLGEGGVESW